MKAHDKTLNAIAKKYNRSTAQILIRWSLERGWVSLPKSDTPSRIKANADIYDFELGTEDMKTLNDFESKLFANYGQTAIDLSLLRPFFVLVLGSNFPSLVKLRFRVVRPLAIA